MIPTGFSKIEGEREDGIPQSPSLKLSQQVPALHSDALKLANESLSCKVWALFKGYFCARPCGKSILRAISEFTTALQVSWA